MKKIITDRKGEGYFDVCVGIIALLSALVISLNVNEQNGITKNQAKAMEAGSKFGWDNSASDPKTYEIDEKLMKRKNKDRGDAR